MAIRIRESTADDLPAIARIASAAFHPATDVIAARLFPAQLQEQETVRDYDVYSWRYAKKTSSLSSPHAVMVVAIDDSLPATNQVVGFGLWDVYEYKHEATHSTLTQTDSEKAANQPQSTVHELPPPSFDQEAYAELRAIVSADHQAMFGERGIKDVWHLDYLGVDPQHQRKGIGRMLLDWGLRRAASDGKDCYLMATPAGRALYAKTGFEVVRTVPIFGVLHHSMIYRQGK
ncbi:putative GNAT family acetyltransferase [Trichoderma novae-zelandiae]